MKLNCSWRVNKGTSKWNDWKKKNFLRPQENTLKDAFSSEQSEQPEPWLGWLLEFQYLKSKGGDVLCLKIWLYLVPKKNKQSKGKNLKASREKNVFNHNSKLSFFLSLPTFKKNRQITAKLKTIVSYPNLSSFALIDAKVHKITIRFAKYEPDPVVHSEAEPCT